MLKGQDLFKSDIAFRENGGGSFTSTAGVLATIMVYMVTLIYAGNKLVILRGREDSRLSEYFETNMIGDSAIGYEETNFFFALGIRNQKAGELIENVQEYFSIQFRQPTFIEHQETSS